MNRTIVWFIFGVCLLCTACSIQPKGVSNGDELVISEALQEKKSTGGKTATGAALEKQTGKEMDELSASEPTPLVSADTVVASAAPTPAVTATYPPIVSDKKIQTYESTGTVVVGDTGFELYNYVSSAANSYTKAINRAAEAIGSKSNVYAMIVPTSVGITLPDNKKKKVNSSDQQKAIRKMEKKLKKSVQAISLYDKLMQHRKEYIYFRTDHHWTGLGAYYAYQQYCESTNRTPHSLNEYKKVSFKGYIGSFYGDTNGNKKLKKDTLYAYYPLSNSKITMKYRTEGGKMIPGNVIEDASNYGISAKYCAFIGGDNSYSVITNKKLHDGSSCVVVKESFGNTLVPYLADHYEKIYVIDYRYWSGKLSGFVKEKKVQDVLFVNNISMTRNAYLIGKLAQIAR